MRKYKYERIPNFPEGVYSTNVEPLPRADDSGLEERPETENDNIGITVNEMFNSLSSVSDTRFFEHKNGFSNLLYGTSIPKARNAEIKGNEEEAQVAMLLYEGGKSKSRTNEMYFGISVHTGKN